jgi:hypothetical protein
MAEDVRWALTCVPGVNAVDVERMGRAGVDAGPHVDGSA